MPPFNSTPTGNSKPYDKFNITKSEKREAVSLSSRINALTVPWAEQAPMA
jgi:hypothetical protein